MDDGSSPSLSSYDYSPFVDERAITHVWMGPAKRQAEGQQVRVYNKCAEEFGGRHKWMGFIDTDEFIEVKGTTKDMTKLPKVGRIWTSRHCIRYLRSWRLGIARWVSWL